MCGTPICVMRTFEGHDGRYPYRDLVKSYCMVGLQREKLPYVFSNQIQHDDELCELVLLDLACNDPYISPSDKTFQVRIDEKSFGRLDFTCAVARLKEEAKVEGDSAREPFMPHYHSNPEASVPFVGELPLWPSAADLNDESRFYMVNRSEWEATGWIFMHLVLVIYSHDKLIVTKLVLMIRSRRKRDSRPKVHMFT
ncbi:hypothetical protein HID58_075563 [Brassica napus]|uniref:Uncharacterized protein n=1 Tax=Brassica napus TaxID=3708 RepID=A0ABQ7YN15_BRANA|nr:hypothetical protein HID58_075563 [Brassica napus]